MFKSLIATCAVGACAAAVIAPAASASPVLTYPTGTAVAAGASWTAANVGVWRFTGAFNISCSTAHMAGTVTENSDPVIRMDVSDSSYSGTGANSDCTTAFGSAKVIVNSLAWCIRSTKAVHTMELVGGNCTEASRPIKFIAWVTGVGECKYQAPSGMVGTFKTHPEDFQLTFLEQQFTLYEGSAWCPSSGKVDATYTFESPSGGAMYVS